ncbi:unnamed protein product [Gadus morhua 'NCC']
MRSGLVVSTEQLKMNRTHRLWLRRADGGAKTVEDDITLPTKILESGGLTEKPHIRKANHEDNQDSSIKDSSHT